MKTKLCEESENELRAFHDKNFKDELLRKEMSSLLSKTPLTKPSLLKNMLINKSNKNTQDIFIACDLDGASFLEGIFNKKIHVSGDDAISISFLSFNHKKILLIVDCFFPGKTIFIGEYNQKHCYLGDIFVGPFPIFFRETIVDNYINKKYSLNALCVEKPSFNKCSQGNVISIDVSHITNGKNYSYKKYVI